LRSNFEHGAPRSQVFRRLSAPVRETTVYDGLRSARAARLIDLGATIDQHVNQRILHAGLQRVNACRCQAKSRGVAAVHVGERIHFGAGFKCADRRVRTLQRADVPRKLRPAQKAVGAGDRKLRIADRALAVGREALPRKFGERVDAPLLVDPLLRPFAYPIASPFIACL
jgi:hypothetical protein